MDFSQHPVTDEQRTELFREFAADQLRRQTKFLDTIRTLMILWTVLAAVGVLFAVLGSLAS